MPLPTKPQNIFSLSIQSFYQPLLTVPTAEQVACHKKNLRPGLITSRLQELVPLCKFNGLVIESVTDQETVGSLPLLSRTINQNGTHQGSVFYLLSEYVAGTAVFARLPGTYVLGIHDRCPGQPIQMWAKSNSVLHLRPGTGLIKGRSRLSVERAEELREKLIQKGRCEIQMHVDIYQGEVIIATAEPVIGVYAITPKLPHKKMDVFQRENSKLSAKLTEGLSRDEPSQKIAGEQGQALAGRFIQIVPAFGGFVAARRKHLGQYLRKTGEEFTQVVELAIGLTPRPIQYASKRQQWFGMDYRHLCMHRKYEFDCIKGDSQHLKLVGVDGFSRGWAKKLIQEGFDGSKATFFILEGFVNSCPKEDFLILFEEISALTLNPRNRVWIDHLTPDLYHHKEKQVLSFFSTMSRLGEPFVFGFSKIEDLFGKWLTQEQCSAATLLSPNDNEDYLIYKNHLMSIVAPNWFK